MRFFHFDVEIMDMFMHWLNYDDSALCSLRTGSKQLRSTLTDANTISSDFIQSCLLQMHIDNRCPKPTEDWTPETPNCSSPFCRVKTGLWVPCRRHNLPLPCADSVYGSETFQSFLQSHSRYKYVVCSVPCHARVKQLLALRHQSSCSLIIAVADYVPALSREEIQDSIRILEVYPTF